MLAYEQGRHGLNRSIEVQPSLPKVVSNRPKHKVAQIASGQLPGKVGRYQSAGVSIALPAYDRRLERYPTVKVRRRSTHEQAHCIGDRGRHVAGDDGSSAGRYQAMPG